MKNSKNYNFEKFNICEHERISPVDYILSEKGEFIIDFGRILTGYVEVKIKGRKNDEIIIKHLLSPNENRCNSVTYILKTDKEESLKDTSCICKFRYICLDKFPIENVGDDTSFTAIAVYPDIKLKSSLVCGNEKINNLFRNLIWDQKCDLLSCFDGKNLYSPSKIQSYIETVSNNFDCKNIFNECFEVTDINIFVNFLWNVYLNSESIELLEKSYAVIIKKLNCNTETKYKNFDDLSRFHHTISIIIKIAEIIGENTEKLEKILCNIEESIAKKYESEKLSLEDYAIALYYDVIKNKETAYKQIYNAVSENKKYHLNYDIYLLQALIDLGYKKTVYDIILSDNNDFNSSAEKAALILKNMCGIRIDENKGEGCKYIVIEPKTDKRIGFFNYSTETVYGKLEVNWYTKDDKVNYEINIPRGITALLKLPGRRIVETESGSYIFSCNE